MSNSKYVMDASQGSQHEIFPGVRIHSFCAEKMMLAFVELDPHSVVQPHEHPHEQVGILLEGELTFHIGDETHHVLPGQMWRIPGGVQHSVITGDKPARALDVFHPIRDDYR
ncbi:MAG: cupin domain-containing protein [Planctomycetes bacterium]|nr:cupin domain-containing protein [Planctomycetota bacterium]